MEDKITFDELLENEVKKYPQLLIWNNLMKIISIVPALLYLIILAVISIESPDSVGLFTLRGFLYFACYGGFLNTFFKLEKMDLFVIVFGVGTVAFFVNNLFYTGVASIIGVLIDLVIVWIFLSVSNYNKAKNDAQMRAFTLNRYQLNKKTEQDEAVVTKAAAEKKIETKNAIKDLESQATFSKAFEEFQKNK